MKSKYLIAEDNSLDLRIISSNYSKEATTLIVTVFLTGKNCQLNDLELQGGYNLIAFQNYHRYGITIKCNKTQHMKASAAYSDNFYFYDNYSEYYSYRIYVERSKN